MVISEVSVIIPTCNRETMLLRAVRSVLEQTYRNYELIIVDDGSTDGTQQSIAQLQNPNIKYRRFESCSGTSAKPRNAGIGLARGKYIAFLDDDDEWLPTLLEKFVDKLKTVDARVGVLYCGLIHVDPQGNVLKTEHPMLRGKLWPLMLSHTIGSLSSCLIKRECFDEVGTFDIESPEAHGDMWIRLAKHYDYDYVPEALALYHIHENQMTNSRSRIHKLKARLKKFANEYAKYPGEFQTVRSRIGRQALTDLIAGDRRQGLECLPEILHYNGQLRFLLVLPVIFISPGLSQWLHKLYWRLISIPLWNKK